LKKRAIVGMKEGPAVRFDFGGVRGKPVFKSKGRKKKGGQSGRGRPEKMKQWNCKGDDRIERLERH